MVRNSARSTWKPPCGLSRTAEDDETELRSHTAPFTPVWTSIAPDFLQK